MNQKYTADYGEKKNTVSEKSSRIQWVDIAKGLGIFFVFLGHTTFQDEPWRVWIYAFHMPLFFFLSGITYNEEKYQQIKDLLLSKFKSIFIPYIALCMIELISYFITLLHGFFRGGKIDLAILCKKIAGILIGIRGTPWYCAYWFLLCICAVYVFMYLLIKSARKMKLCTPKTLVVWLSSILLCCGIVYGKLRLPYLPWAIDVAFVSTFFSILGWKSKADFAKKISGKLMWGAAGGSILFCMLNFYYSGISIDMYSNRYGYGLLFILAALLGSIFVIAVSQRINDKRGIIAHIGKNSLYYYGVNVLVLKIVDVLTYGLFHVAESENGVSVFVKCIIKATFAMGLSRIFLPCFNMMKNYLLGIWKVKICTK